MKMAERGVLRFLLQKSFPSLTSLKCHFSVLDSESRRVHQARLPLFFKSFEFYHWLRIFKSHFEVIIHLYNEIIFNFDLFGNFFRFRRFFIRTISISVTVIFLEWFRMCVCIPLSDFLGRVTSNSLATFFKSRSLKFESVSPCVKPGKFKFISIYFLPNHWTSQLACKFAMS